MSLTQQEFRRVYEQQQPLLVVQFRRQYRDLADEVEDVVQDTFAKLWRHFGATDDPTVAPKPVPDDVGGWLFRTANNAMIDRTRMKKRRPTSDVQEVEATASAADRDALAEARRAVDAALGGAALDDGDDAAAEDPIGSALDVMHAVLPALKERDRVILTLKYIDGLAYPDIAERLGLSPGAVGTTLLRARRAARALFEQELERQRVARAARRRHIS